MLWRRNSGDFLVVTRGNCCALNLCAQKNGEAKDYYIYKTKKSRSFEK